MTLALGAHAHVFALDQRGHGESSRPGIYSFEVMRDDLKAFADALSLERFTLIGHSMGTTVAFLFTEMWSERVERIIIEDTPPPYAGGPAAEPPDEPSAPVPFDWRLIKPLYAQLRTPDPLWWNGLSTLPVPTLLIGGGSTSTIPQEKLAEAAHLIPDCRLIIIEHGGHYIHQNCFSAYKETVQQFLLG